jgi:hypothetical protein
MYLRPYTPFCKPFFFLFSKIAVYHARAAVCPASAAVCTFPRNLLALFLARPDDAPLERSESERSERERSGQIEGCL